MPTSRTAVLLQKRSRTFSRAPTCPPIFCVMRHHHRDLRVSESAAALAEAADFLRREAEARSRICTRRPGGHPTVFLTFPAPRRSRHVCAIGVSPRELSFSNTIKKASVIADSHSAGVDLFSFDSAGELEKIAANAPGAKVTVQVLSHGKGADWPLSRKFGCEPAGNGVRSAAPRQGPWPGSVWHLLPRWLPAARSRPVGRT